MMIRIVRHLQDEVDGPPVTAVKVGEELYLTFAADEDRATTISVGLDASDYALRAKGVPPYHYRVNYTVPKDVAPYPLSVDRRCDNVRDVGSVVLEAIARCR